MRKGGLSQEGLKIIACVAMVVDHIGAVFVPWVWMRVVGRIAFPIFCFLICEGVGHTRDLRRYLMRLGIGAVVAELPFDLLFYGGVCWAHQNVMVTLLLGACVVGVWRGPLDGWVKGLVMGGLALLAEVLGADYGAMGVLMIVSFAVPVSGAVRFVLMAVICWSMGGIVVAVFGVPVPVQMFALVALVPIGLYSGRKRTSGWLARWGFYSFYPVHMLVLLVMRGALSGG